MDTQREYIASLDPTDDEAWENLPTEPTDSEKLDELLSILRPLAPVLKALPEVMEQALPIIEGLKKSPVLKALGVRIP